MASARMIETVGIRLLSNLTRVRLILRSQRTGTCLVTLITSIARTCDGLTGNNEAGAPAVSHHEVMVSAPLS
eukprot:1188808-Prorocentrum_minimum.AAC.4